MFLFKKNLNLIYVYVLSFPTGLSIWGLIPLILFISGIPFHSPVIISLSLLLLTIFVTLNRKYNNFSKKELIYFIIFLVSFILLSIFFVGINYSTLSNDSWRLLIGGKYLTIYNDLSESLLASGGIFFYIIHSPGHFLGFDYFYALYPLLTLFFLLFHFYGLYSSFTKKRLAFLQGLLYSSLTILFLLSSYLVLFYAIYIHSNLICGIYSFIALYGIWKRLISGNKQWLLISALALLTFSFMRVEGPLFSLTIIIVLMSTRAIKFREKLCYIGTIFLFVEVWHLKLFFSLSEYSGKYFNSGKALWIVILYFLTLVVLVLSQKGILNRLKEYFPLIMLYTLSIGWSLLIFTKGLKIKGGILILKKYGIFILNTVKYGGWGITWIVLVALFGVALLLKRLRYESVFVYYIFSFLLLFNSIHLFRGGWRYLWGDSGNRMLINIIFIISFYTFLKFRRMLFSR